MRPPDMPLETRAILEEFFHGASLRSTRRKLRWLKIKRIVRGV